MVDTEIYSIIALSPGNLLRFSEVRSAFAYYKSWRLNLLTGKREAFDLERLNSHLCSRSLDSNFNTPVVYHFFYEYGYYYQGESDLIREDDLLLLELKYNVSTPFVPSDTAGQLKIESLHEVVQDHYNECFARGYDQLVQGNCYQFNLTFPFIFKIGNPNLLLDKLWMSAKGLGAFAHASIVPALDKIYFSNSPECLFAARKDKNELSLWSMPIKGSVPLKERREFKTEWVRLKNSKKNQGELNMITDLLSNDLNRIDRPIARVVKKQLPLMVPGILHQYSLVSVRLKKNISLGKIMAALFPGGSVTGAPKKKVMKILNGLETAPRGFYCGSTVVLYKDILASSINIRSGEIDTKKSHLRYGAGGGITLLSDKDEEFAEMYLKLNSFKKLYSDFV